MRLHYSCLREKDRRQYAAVEAIKPGYGGLTYISRLLCVDRKTIIEGKKELLKMAAQQEQTDKQRCRGGGRKKKAAHPDINHLLAAFIEAHKAGSPTDEKMYWISVKPWQLAELFYEKHHIRISHGVIKRLLKASGYAYRKQSKQLATGSYARRNEQFGIICSLILMMSLQSPVLSIDCKKKERLGNLYRAGKCYCTKAVKVYDHDYEHLSEGKVIPHGIYDIQANKGYISIGSSRETAGFVMDNLLWWWLEHGIHHYPDANNILLLCDAGGANSYRHFIFKLQLQAFSRETGLSVIVCHYPPYCSRWNPT